MRCPVRRRRRQRASALVESLLAAPVVLMLGLGALQWAFVFHARSALEYAVFEAARAGSVAYAQPGAIEEGLARGLLPFWQGAGMPRSRVAGQAAAQLRLAQGMAAGWIDWQQLAPTQQSFADWAEPALDEAGYPVAGSADIPNDSLQWSWLRAPAGGIAAMRGREPIGGQSRQTLNDANLLKLELRYGVPLSVPFVGTIAAWIARIAEGCEAPTRKRIGLVDLGTPGSAGTGARAWACAVHHARDADGRAIARWPVRVSATIRMQSPARRSAKTPQRAQSSVPLAPTAASADPAIAPRPLPAEPGNVPAGPLTAGSPVRTGAGADGSRQRDDGWLAIGGERTFSVPGACDGP